MIEFRDSDESSRLSTDAIQTHLNSANSSPINTKFNNSNNTVANLTTNLINNSNSSSSTNSTTSINLTNSNQNTYRSNEVHEVILYGVPIIALVMENEERLCLAQISNTLLKNYSYNEIHNRRVALQITCVQCTPVQLELLRRAGAMPVSSRRCGMITKREAERLCKSFLTQTLPPKIPENYEFQVYHRCNYGCDGHFVPTRYNSSRAKCIRCTYCKQFFSPNKFIFHSHEELGNAFQVPDAANFNSWRKHIKLVEGASEIVINLWEEVKAMFNGGSRKRAMSATLNSVSKQQQQQKQQHQQQQLTRNLVSNTLSLTNTSSNNTQISNNRRSKISNQSSRKVAKIKNLSNQEDDDEELIVDDDYKPIDLKSSLQANNLLNNQLFGSSNNSNLDDESSNLNVSTPNSLPLNLLSSVSNCHNNSKLLNQHHSSTFQTNTFSNSNNNTLNPCINDLQLQLNSSNNLTQRPTSQNANTSLTNNINININNRSLNNGQLDVVQAMLPMLGQEFIWPTHPLNSLSQLSNLNNLSAAAASQQCSNLSSNHLNTIQSNSNFSNKSSFPQILYNSPATSLLFQPNNIQNQFNHTNQQNKNLPEQWLNKNLDNAQQQSAFKKVNTINKLLEDNHFSLRRSLNDFSVENLSKSKKTKLSLQLNDQQPNVKKFKEEEDIDVENSEEKIAEIKNENKINLTNNEKLNDELKCKLNEKNQGRKKVNSTNSLGELSEEDEEYSNSPVRSQSVNIKNLLSNEQANCQLSGCNNSTNDKQINQLNNDLRLNSNENKLIDLSNSLIKNNTQELSTKLISSVSKEPLDLVNNLISFNNRNYSNDLLFNEEEIKKRIQLNLFEYIRNNINNVNKSDYIHQKLN